MANILEALASLKANGGFSYNLNTGELNPEYGFAVAKDKQFEMSFAVGNINRKTVPDIVRVYAQKTADLLAQDGAFLGAWFDDGLLYLDVSELVATEVEAIRLCQERKQLAYYNNGLKQAVYLPKGTHTGGLHNSVGFHRPIGL